MKILAYVIFGLMPALGILAAVRVWLFVRGAIRQTVKISGHKSRKTSQMLDSTEMTYLPIVTFHDEKGIWREVTLSSERPLRMRGIRDDEVNIIYRPGRAAEAKLDHWSLVWIVPLFLCAPAALLLIALLFLYITARLGM
ncbi:MAG: hypothetical protein ABI972_26340 [Acidobacteriota bacterium]